MGCNWSCCNFCSYTSGSSSTESKYNTFEVIEYLKSNVYLLFVFIAMIQIISGIYVLSANNNCKIIIASLMISGIFHAMLSGFVFNIKKLKKIEYIISACLCAIIIIFNSVALNELLKHPYQSSDDGLFNLSYFELKYVLLLEAICVTLWAVGLAFGSIYLYIIRNVVSINKEELDDILIHSN